MRHETRIIEKMKTRVPALLLNRKKEIKTKWVFIRKLALAVNVTIYRVLLVEKWFSQKHGVDYHEVSHHWKNTPRFD